MATYDEVYPRFFPEVFRLPGEDVIGIMQPKAFETARQAILQKGGHCPCCGQHVQVYRRQIYKRMAKCIQWVVAAYNANHGKYIDLKDGPMFRGGDNTKLAYWKLILAHPDKESLYVPTEIAVAFVRNAFAIPKHCYVYNGIVMGFGREKVKIADCLEGDFNMDDIGIPPWPQE